MKGTAGVISNDPITPFIKWQVQFTMVPLNTFSDQTLTLIIYNCGFSKKVTCAIPLQKQRRKL